MNKKLYDIFAIILVLLFLTIGVYHALMMLINSGWIAIDKSILYAVYGISYNLIIISSLHFIGSIVRYFDKEYKLIKIRTITLILSVYPTIIVIINILCLFKPISELIRGMVNFIGVGLIALITLILIIIKMVKY